MTQTELFHASMPRKADDDFKSLYATTENKTLAKKYGVSVDTISRWGKDLGLEKDRNHWRAMQAERAKGQIKSEETRRKISEKAMGRTMTAETKEKVRRTREERGSVPKGPNHYKWKGGRTWERFKDPDYIAWRNTVLERDGYVCQDCSRQCKKYEKGLAAHHKKPYATHPDLRLEISNGVTLCRRCHMTRHSRAPQVADKIPCACGCGTMIAPVDPYGRPRKFVNFHGIGKGSGNHRASLTEEDIRAIRADTRKQHEIAAQYGISRVNVSVIKSRRTWKHVE